LPLEVDSSPLSRPKSHVPPRPEWTRSAAPFELLLRMLGPLQLTELAPIRSIATH